MSKRREDDVDGWSAQAIEPEWLGAIDRTARTVLGARDRTGAALAAAVRRLSDRYTLERDELAGLRADETSIAARLRFFLPRDLAKIELPLDELARAGALPSGRRWRVLDLGAGLGTTTLGTARFAATRRAADSLDVVAVDRDRDALDVLDSLAAHTRGGELGSVAVPVEVRTTLADLERVPLLDLSARGSTPFDLVLVGLALNELWIDAPPDEAIARRAAYLGELARLLAPGGALIVIEPALRSVTRALQAVRDVIAASPEPPFVFAPCLRDGPCPMLAGGRTRDWCHDELAVALPPALADIARAAGLRRETLTSSHLTLRNDARRLRDAVASLPGIPLRAVSARLVTKGKMELFACGEPGIVRLQRLDRHESSDNAALDTATRGSLFSLDGLELPPGDDDGTRVRVGPGARVLRPARGGDGT